MTNDKYDKYYGKRGAERLLGMAPYTIDRVAKHIPLPTPAVMIDGAAGWTETQLREWYAKKPKWGGARHRKTK